MKYFRYETLFNKVPRRLFAKTPGARTGKTPPGMEERGRTTEAPLSPPSRLSIDQYQDDFSVRSPSHHRAAVQRFSGTPRDFGGSRDRHSPPRVLNSRSRDVPRTRNPSSGLINHARTIERRVVSFRRGPRRSCARPTSSLASLLPTDVTDLTDLIDSQRTARQADR